MLRSTIHKTTVLLVVAAFALGCELVVDFDRTKIPVDVPDTGEPTEDATIFDASPSVDASDVSDAGDSGDDAGDASDADDSGD